MTYKSPQPGIGAIEFAEPFIDGLDRDEAKPVITRLMAGDLHDTADKRIKTCRYCGYYFRDKTKPNNGNTCSRDCKKEADKITKRKKRADESLLEPEKQPKQSDDYTYWLEYPFFVSEAAMNKQTTSSEVSRTTEKVEVIEAAARRSLNGRKKKKLSTPYDGRDTFAENQQDVAVKAVINPQLNRHKKDKQHGEVKTYHMDAEAIDHELKQAYTDRELQQERRRARKKTWKKTG